MLTVLMRYVIMVVVVKPGDGDGARYQTLKVGYTAS
jgi:hypothetical protein